jgi:glutamyl-Q tRNA(Asp) synthetase
MNRPGYRGRFAPSPTGPLHFGSLTAAVGSYLEARFHNGEWLLRMEDLDTPRTVAGAADDILRTLEACGLYWDETIVYQSRRTTACACTRREIADSALHGIDGPVYPGTCRNGLPEDREGRTWRVRTNNEAIEFDDALQGHQLQHLDSEIGDFVVKRADGLFAYQLAVVVDDAFQNITHVVRGADLLASTPRQIYLQHLLGLTSPHYMHLPVAINAAGEKLSKQTLAAPVDRNKPSATLWHALTFLQQSPPPELQWEKPEIVLEWALQNWRSARLRGIATLPI